MELYDTLNDFLRSCPDNGVNFEIQSAFLKAWDRIHGWNGDGKSWTMYPVILTAISGGADSDVTLDMLERIGHSLSEVHYVFYDSGLEFETTKRHLDFLEEKYGVSIERRKAKVPVPLGVKRFGLPLIRKKRAFGIHEVPLRKGVSGSGFPCSSQNYLAIAQKSSQNYLIARFLVAGAFGLLV